MFAASFGLSENPFKITPNLRFVYLGENFRKVRGEAASALAARNGAVLLTARAGIGKSILLRLLAQDLGAASTDRVLSLVCSPGSTVDQLVHQALESLDARSGGTDASEDGDSGPAPAADHLQRLVAECVAEGRACVLLIDEAQNLSDHELGRLFLLIDQVDHHGGRLRIALAGPPDLESRLNQALPNDFRRQIILRRRLEPLPEREVAAFIAERLRLAGAPRDDIFSDDAIARIAHYAEGVPRLVNSLCQTALFLAEFESSDTVTADLVDEAARQIGVAPPESSKAVILAPERRPATLGRRSAKANRPPLLTRLDRIDSSAQHAVDVDHVVIQPDFVPGSRTTHSRFARSRTWPGLLFGALATAAVFATVFVLLEKPGFLTGTTAPSSPPPITPAEESVAAMPDPVIDEEEVGAEAEAPVAPTTDETSTEATGRTPSTSPAEEEPLALPPAPPVDPNALAELGAPSGEAPDNASKVEAAERDAAARQDAAPVETAEPDTREAADAESIATAPADAAAGARAPAAAAKDATATEPTADAVEPSVGRTASAPAERQAAGEQAMADSEAAAQNVTASSESASTVAPSHAPEAAPTETTASAETPQAEAMAEDGEAAIRETRETPQGEATIGEAVQSEADEQQQAAVDTAAKAAAVADGPDGDASETAPAPPAAEQRASAEPSANAAESPANAAAVQTLLERAREQINDLKLTTPAGDNAFETYQQVLALAPGHEAVSQGFRDIADKYILLAESAERQGRPDQAQRYYEKAAAVVPDHPIAVAALSQRQAETAAAPAAAPAAQQPTAPSTVATAAPATEPDRTPEPSQEDPLDRLLARVFGDGAAPPAAETSVAAPAALPKPDAAPPTRNDGAEPASSRFPMPAGALQTPERLEAALAAGADVNTRFANGQTPLIIAASQRQSDMVELLLAHGAEPNAATETLGTPLMYAVWNGDLASVEALLRGGADIDLKNIDGKTALMAAAANGHLALVDLLLRYGASVNDRTINGWTALMYAVWGRHDAVVARLLEHGADVSVVNEDGDSATSIAIERGHFEIANMLRSQQARNE